MTKKWQRKGNFQSETESFLSAAKNSTIRTKYLEGKIDNMQQKSKCRLSCDTDEIINYVINWHKGDIKVLRDQNLPASWTLLALYY